MGEPRLPYELWAVRRARICSGSRRPEAGGMGWAVTQVLSARRLPGDTWVTRVVAAVGRGTSKQQADVTTAGPACGPSLTPASMLDLRAIVKMA